MVCVESACDDGCLVAVRRCTVEEKDKERDKLLELQLLAQIGKVARQGAYQRIRDCGRTQTICLIHFGGGLRHGEPWQEDCSGEMCNAA